MRKEHKTIEQADLANVTGGLTQSQRAYNEYVGMVAEEPARTPTYRQYAAKFRKGFIPCETAGDPVHSAYVRWRKTHPGLTRP